MLKDTCSKLKRDIRMLEKAIQKLEQANEILTSEKDEKAFALSKDLDTLKELERVNKILKCEKFEAEEKTLALGNDLNALKDLLNTRGKEFNSDLTRLESESLDLKFRLESLVSENNKLLEKAHKTESDLVQNRRWNCFSAAHAHKVESDLVQNKLWNSSSEALNWLNTHHSRNKRGLEFVNRPITKPVNKKYVGLKENITCFHCGNGGHYQHTCLLRKRAMERNSL